MQLLEKQEAMRSRAIVFLPAMVCPHVVWSVITMLCQLYSCWLICEVCHGHCHPARVKMDDTVAAMLQPLITTVGWVCPLCRSELVQLRSVKTDILEMVGEVKEELKQLRIDFDSYRMAHPTPTPTSVPLWPQPTGVSVTAPTATNSVDTVGTKAVLAEVHREFLEKERRKRNVVVSGLKKQDSIDDVNAFLDLCEECLPVKPLVIRERSH